jgi:hypothetical protein
MSKSIFYVYIYFDPRKKGKFTYEDLIFEFEPFYVGKGSNGRMYEHLCQTGRCYKVNKINSIRRNGLEPIIVKYKESMNEQDAYDLECQLVKKIGRRNLKEGPLANLKDGGKDGRRLKMPETAKQILREKAIKSWGSMTDEKLQQQIERWQETMMQRFGVRNVAWGFKGKKHSHDTKKKMSEKATERKGEKNSQFGTCWIMKNGQSVKIKTEQIEQFIQDGWTKGRTLKRKQ